MEILNINTIFFAIIGGGLPVLVWLWFWLREDKKNPEPKRIILLTFIGGMFAALISIISQNYTLNYLEENFHLSKTVILYIMAVLIVPIIEELSKYTTCHLTSLKNKENDEPLDPIIYMITAALGFSALENILYILQPITNKEIVESLITGNLRFIGATLVHTLSSASVGFFLALSFYKARIIKTVYLIIGIITAIILHSYFNFFIIKSNQIDGPFGDLIMFSTFIGVWIMAVILILIFEKIKNIKPN